jgi:hypothetical protein
MVTFLGELMRLMGFLFSNYVLVDTESHVAPDETFAPDFSHGPRRRRGVEYNHFNHEIHLAISGRR